MSTETAIQGDVVDETGKTDIVVDEQVPPEPAEKVDRETIMDQITERRTVQIAEEISGEPIVEDPPVEDNLPVEDPPVEESALIAVKIDGVESNVTTEDIREVVGGTGDVTEEDVRQYQKHKTADGRLEEASQRDADLAAKEADLTTREAALTAKENAVAAEAEVSTVDDINVDELAEQLITKTFAEDKEGVAEIITKIRGPHTVAPAQAAGITQENVDQAVKASLTEGERDKAVSKFAENYPALEKNPGLRSAVNARTVIEREKDSNAPIWDIIERAAKYVKKETAEALGFEVKEEVPEVAVDDPVVIPKKEERVDAKRGAGPAVKATAATKAAIVKEEPIKLTPFQEIQKSRGQG